MALGTLDRSDDRAPYRQIADQLRGAIDRGELRPGDRLPSEAELMRHYGVARMTARQAIQELRTEGRVVAEQGRGVFVRLPAPVRRLASDRFARGTARPGKAAFLAEAEKAGVRPQVDQIEVNRAPAPRMCVSGSSLADGEEAVVRSRRYLADGHPIETAVSYIPADLAEGTRIAEQDTGPGRDLRPPGGGRAPAGRFTEEVTARMPTADERRRLQLAAARPC